MIKKILNGNFLNDRPTQSITAAAVIISVAAIASRVLGLFRDRILASNFGAGDTLDIYYAAFRIPDLVYNLLVLGALSAAFIPVFTSLHSTDREKDAWKLASGMLNLQTLAVFIISVILAISSPWLLHLITPGFSDLKIAQTSVLSRIMFLSPILLGVSAVFGGILVSFKKFLIYSMAPIFYNIGIIIGVIFFVPMMGNIGLAWGVVLGAAMHMLVQYPAVKYTGFRYLAFSWEILKNEHIRKVVRLMIPRTLGIAVNQFNLLIITIFASTLSAGSLAIFTFANNIQMTPVSLFGSSFAIAVFPLLSTLAAKKMQEEFLNNFSIIMKQILFFIVPISIALIILRAQIVRVILGAGKFDWEDTVLTFDTMAILAMSLVAQALIPLLTRSFYALHNTKTPFYIALVSEAVNIILVIVLIKKYLILGLAIAFSASSAVNMGLLFLYLKGYFRDYKLKGLVEWLINLVIISGAMGLAIQASKHLTDRIFNIDTFVGIFSQLTISSLAGALIFVIFCYVFKIEEYHYFKNSLLKRLRLVKPQVNENISEI